MQVYDAIQTKRAVRSFTQKRILEESIRAILNAGRRAQSAKNVQPWHFIAIRDEKTLQALAETGHFAGHLSGAALGIAILTPSPDQRFSVMFDAGQAAAYMQLAAWELGIGSCLATIYDPDEARNILGFPADLHLRIVISFGYPKIEEDLSRPPQVGGRRSFNEVVHWDNW